MICGILPFINGYDVTIALDAMLQVTVKQLIDIPHSMETQRVASIKGSLLYSAKLFHAILKRHPT